MAHIEKDRQALHELELELIDLTAEERIDAEAYVDELRAELELSELMQRRAQETIDRAKKLASVSFDGVSGREQIKTKPVSIDLSRIGWINEGGETSYTADVVRTDTLEYLLVDLTTENSITNNARLRLESQKVTSREDSAEDGSLIDKLYDKLKTEVIPQRHDNMLHGRKMRVVHAGVGHDRIKNNPRRTFKTDYHTTKEDVYGTNNRAIVMYLGNDESTGLPTYALAAIYDHDDDRPIHSTMCYSQK